MINCTTAAISLTSHVTGTLQAAQFPALTGDITTTAGSLATTIGSGKVTNAMLAGSIAASKLVGTDIATVGTITAGVWSAGAVTSAGAITGTNFIGSGTLTGITGAAIGTSSVAGTAYLEIQGTQKGFLPPRMTTTQRDAISAPATGLTIYNTTTNAMNVYNGSAWGAVGSGAGGSSGQLQYNTGTALGGTAAAVYAASGDLITVTAQAATDKPLIVKGAASQSGDLVPFLDSSGSAVASVSAVGSVLAPRIRYSGVAGGVGVNGAGGTAAGSSGDVQYNNGNALAGATGLVYATSGTNVAITAQAAGDKPLIVKGATSQSANLFEVQNSSSTALVMVNSSGSVGIGTTTAVAPLTVSMGGGRIASYDATTASSTVYQTFTQGGSIKGYIGLDSSAGGGLISGGSGLTGSALTLIANTGSKLVLLADAGNPTNGGITISGNNVGIGTTSPSAKLAVNGEILNASAADASPFTQARIIAYRDISNWGYIGYGNDAQMRIVYGITSNAATKLHFGQSSANDNTGSFTSRVTIDGVGNVGIGTASPGQKLSVAGTIESTSGGVKFPDGTTQATAASGSPSGTLCGYYVNVPEVGTTSVNCQGYSPYSSCPSGYTRSTIYGNGANGFVCVKN